MDWNKDSVKALRKHCGMSQKDFSKLLAGRQQTIADWEVGNSRPGKLSGIVLTKIAENYGFEEGE